MNKVLATLIAGLISVGAFAQAPAAPAKEVAPAKAEVKKEMKKDHASKRAAHKRAAKRADAKK